MSAPPIDPFRYQLSRNWPDILEKIALFRRQGTSDIATWCILTTRKGAMEEIAKVTGYPCEPDEADAQGHGGTAGAGPRRTVVDLLQRLYGHQHSLALQLERFRPQGDSVPVFVALPDDRCALIVIGGRN